MMEMQGNATEIDERNLLQLDALLSHGYGLSPQLVMRSKGLSIEAKALYGYLSSFAGAGTRLSHQLPAFSKSLISARTVSTISARNWSHGASSQSRPRRPLRG